MTLVPFAAGVVVVVASITSLVPAVDGHAYLIEPLSRQYLRTPEFNDGEVHYLEKWAGSYNGGGGDAVKQRTLVNIDQSVLSEYGGGDVWIVAAAWDKGERCENNNYLESDKIAVGHGVCGDPPQGLDDESFNEYSTPNTLWSPISSYASGSIVELKAVVNNNHWGHIEYFLCDTADMADPGAVVTHDCLNTYPLDRDVTDGYNSPIDPNYPGRFFVNPECRGETGETDQTGRPDLSEGEGGLDQGWINTGRYHLPNIECEHCVLQMKYYAYVGCHHPGYHEFEPEEWPGQCAADKEAWLPYKTPACNEPGRLWSNTFYACADVTLTANGVDTIAEPADPADTGTTDGDEYIGCYADSRLDRLLGEALMDRPDMTQTVCREHCEVFGAPFYATQYGEECWCGWTDNEEDYMRHGTGSCTMECSGDPSTTCGGFDSFDLFKYVG